MKYKNYKNMTTAELENVFNDAIWLEEVMNSVYMDNIDSYAQRFGFSDYDELIKYCGKVLNNEFS